MEAYPQPHSIRVSGAELTFVEQGQGDAVVFVHGALGDYRDSIEVMPPFAERYRVISYSRRRHWPNAWPDDDSGCEAPVHAADLTTLIDALELAPAHLIGFSYGALTSLLVAADQANLVRTLVLGEPPLMQWLSALPDGQPAAADFTAAVNACGEAFARGESEAGVRGFVDAVIGEEGAFDQIPPDNQAVLMDNAAELRLGVDTSFETMHPPFFCEDARQVRVPTLLLGGELSPLFFSRITEELARCLPIVERVTIPGVSHDLGDPQGYIETVLAFLAKH